MKISWIMGVLAAAGSLGGCEQLLGQGEDDDEDERADAGDAEPQGPGNNGEVEPIEERLRQSDQMPQVRVSAGTFLMGRDDGPSNEAPQRSVTITRDYFIDRHEVTVAQWDECERAGACSPEDRSDKATLSTCNVGAAGLEGHPVNCVLRPGAEAYCAFVGGRLPTEAEWEYAARGQDGRPWPWGDVEPSCDRVVMTIMGGGCDHFGTQPVESLPFGESPFGALDMAGNVSELVQDFFSAEAYAALPDTDPAFLEDTGEVVYRGGAFNDGSINRVRTTQRHRSFARVFSAQIGFRCVNEVP